MSEQDRNNPLHGVGLDTMFSELLRHYHWEILSEQLRLKCLENYPNFASATKFLKKTTWAREKTEAFYLYRFKQLPIPSDEEHALPPRERSFSDDLESKEPAVLNNGDKEFYDDPISGPVFHDKPARSRTKSTSKSSSKSGRFDDETSKDDSSKGRESSDPSDPWGKWKPKD